MFCASEEVSVKVFEEHAKRLVTLHVTAFECARPAWDMAE
jgi:hypothetical protein